jgi:dihydroorotase-like cyclic amidohydrolase
MLLLKQLKYLFVVMVLVASVAAQDRDVRTDVTAFTHVTVIDVKGGPSLQDMTVIVNGRHIAKVGNSRNTKIPPGASLIDATGKYLIPGLWDMHVHVFNNVSERPPNVDFFPLFIANGVTSVRDMWTKPASMPQVRAWRDQVNEKPGTVPRFASVGTLVDGKPVVWPNSDSVTAEQEARQFVRSIKAAGIDFVKVYGHLSREAYFAIADESKKQKIPFAGHVPDDIVGSEIADAGQTTVEHLTGFGKDCTTFVPKMQKELAEAKSKDPGEVRLIEMALDTCDTAKAFSIYQHLARKGVRQVPTFPIGLRTGLSPEQVTSDARLKYVPADEVKSWQGSANKLRNRTPEQRERGKKNFERALQTVREMHKAGILFMVGTDVGNEFVYPGFSLHDDLETFVTAGFTPLEALQTATLNPAVFLGMSRSIGTVEKGKLADLVLLDADPLRDITNTRKIYGVVANGRYLSRSRLDTMLGEVELAAKQKQ